MNTEEKNVAEEVEYNSESVLATVGEWSADSSFELEDRFKQMKQLQNMLFVLGTKFPDGLDYDTLATTVWDRADYMTNDLTVVVPIRIHSITSSLSQNLSGLSMTWICLQSPVRKSLLIFFSSEG